MADTGQSSGTRIVAAMKAGANAEKIIITELSMSGCMARTSLSVNRQQAVKVQLFEARGDGKFDKYTPISASIDSTTRIKSSNSVSYEVKIKFNDAISVGHGIVQAMNQVNNQPEPGQRNNQQNNQHESGQASAQPVDISSKNPNNSLFTIPVTCYMCGEKHIPFQSLQSRTMVSDTNVFGVPQYKEALPGKEFCDYNLVRINVCPSCHYSSGDVGDFHKESRTAKDDTVPFDREQIVAQWNATASQRQGMINASMDGFFSEHRNVEQSLLSYDLAVLTCDEIMKAEMEKKERLRNYEFARKAVLYMMIKAELLINKKQPNEAVDLMKMASSRLEVIFPFLRRESSVKAAFLLGMLGLYFEDHKAVGQNLSFLRQYNENNKVRLGSEEHKALMSSLKRLNEAYQSRADFSRKKLNGFNKPF